jgi:hypothetical protein
LGSCAAGAHGTHHHFHQRIWLVVSVVLLVHLQHRC